MARIIRDVIILMLFFLIVGCQHRMEIINPSSFISNTNNIYYIDSQAGNDSNNGLTPKKAWKTLSKTSSMKYKSGDRILLKRGCVFHGKLGLYAAGNANSPVVINAYPEDSTLPMPIIDSKGYIAGIQIINSSYLEVYNLEIVSDGGTPIESGAKEKRYGVIAIADNGYQSKHIVLKNLYIHQIFSSEQVPSNGQNPTSNKGMGIYFSSAENASFHHILIEQCRIERTGYTGIGIHGNGRNPDLYIRDVKILNNRLKNIGGPGIQPGRCVNVLVSGNVVDHSGSMIDPRMHGRGSGIWPWTCNNVLIEHNSFMYAHGKADSHGAHIDFNCDNVVIQYNLSLENEGGFVEILGNDHNCSYRYNISINDGSRVKGVNGATQQGEILFISGYTGKNKPKVGPFDNYIYNNTIYVRSDIVAKFSLAPTTHGLLVANNIFYILGKTQAFTAGWNTHSGQMKNVIFENNVYKYRNTLPEYLHIQDAHPLCGDPDFANPGGLDPEDYIPSNKALIKDKGIPVTKLPGDDIGLKIGFTVKKDFLGRDIVGTPDIGAIEIK